MSEPLTGEQEEQVREIAQQEIRAAARDLSEGGQLLALTRAITLGSEAIARDEIRRFARLLAAQLDLPELAYEYRALQEALLRFDAGEQA